MRSRTATLIAPVIALTVHAAASFGDTPRPPRTFLFQSLAIEVEVCSGLGADWPRRVAESLQKAKSGTQGFLPADMWDGLLLLSSRTKEGQGIERRQFVNCERSVASLSDPALRIHLRGDTANGMFSIYLTKCMVEFPGTADEIRAAWMNAFARNGFRTPEPEITSGVAEWQRRSVKPRPLDDGGARHCGDLIRFLGEEFDGFFSEEKIVKILLEDLDKKY